MTIGFRIHPMTARIDPGLVERFRSIPVANISDSMSRMSAGGPRLRPMHRGGVLAGPAFTVKARPGDNLMLVFWSPDASTARGLTDFTKSRAAQDAVNAGFAEFQFVDPGTYCYAQVAPVAGVGPISCGIR